MSILIQLSEATDKLSVNDKQPQNFIASLRQILAMEQFHMRHFWDVEQQNGIKKQILVILGKSQQTFIRDMEWKFIFLTEEIRLKVKFFNQTRDNFLKAKTQRMKLQLMILLRSVNERLLAEEEFVVDPATGLLQYHFRITWEQYKKLNQFQEVVYFCEPSLLTNSEQHAQKLHLYDEFLKTTNNFRAILRNTVNVRQMNNQILQKMRELKEHQPKSQLEEQSLKQQQLHMKTLFQRNIYEMYQLSIGLQKNAENDQIQSKCLQTIKYHSNFKDKNNIQPDQSPYAINPENKIVYGIKVIKSDKQKILSKQGAHSQITRGIVLFRLVKSIELQVVKDEPQRWLMGSQKRAELTIKRCNAQNQASINSFMNQLYFLNYVRDFHSSFIAKYYLEAKNFRQRNQKQPIFMKSYYQNIDYVVRKCSTLSIKEKLTIIYQISLGICFLSSKSIIHRDLKPHNIVVNQALTPHLIDFGSCCSFYGVNTFAPYDKRLLTTKFIHIYYHQLPQNCYNIYEKMSKDQYEQHCLFDIYSFGKLISFIMFGTFEPPHYDLIAEDSHADLLKNLIFLIQICLNLDPDDRPCIAEVTGFLGSLSKFYTAYQEYFIHKNLQKIQQRSLSELKPSK